jgi:acyl-CoA thioesterase II
MTMPPTDIESAWPTHPGYAITATPLHGVGRASFDGVVVAESSGCLVVAETGHVDRLYFPAGDVVWEHLTASDRRTICPFKGRASYWSVTVGDESLDDVAWSYPDPFDEVGAIAGCVAFFADRLAVTLTEQGAD